MAAVPVVMAALVARTVEAAVLAGLEAAVPGAAELPATGKISLTVMQKKLDQLVTRLTKAHGSSLVSVVLYGSAVNTEYDDSFSDINILCVLSRITPAELSASEPVFRWWANEGCPPPLLLSEHEVETSTDCFAIEFYDMQQNRRVLFGRDVIATLVVDRSFYRAQVERELRAKVLRLRTKAAAALLEKEPLVKLMADSISTFCVLFRHALLLSGVHVEPKKRAIIAQASQTFGIDSGPFLRLLDVREKKTSLKDIEPVPLFEGYLRELSSVVDVVDRIDK
jgi:hypothetical protein